MNVTGTNMVAPRKNWKLAPGQSGSLARGL